MLSKCGMAIFFFVFKWKRVESVLLPLSLKSSRGSHIQYFVYFFGHVAAMDPKPVKLQENVILKFKSLRVITKAKLN